ncbi:MAG TPA: TetR/AcrR family transcriptional regulator [Solirubrobacterales bacterium]|nr:TetR/AcrR family transcriptional regulator [Solirubrobacterales bacterium]
MSGFFKPADYLSKDPATVDEREAKRLRYDAKQRAKLCRAMVRVTARRGYAGASVHEALRVAGYGKSAYYRHFEDRESCLLEAFERSAATLLGRVGAAAGDGDGPATRVGVGLQAFVEMLGGAPDLARVMLIEVRVAPRCREAQQRWLGRFAELLEGCLSADTSGADGEVARLVAGALLERLASGVRKEGRGKLAEALPDLAFIALAPYAGTEGAMTEMGRYREQLSRRAPKPRVTPDPERSKAERSPREELLARVETMSEEEAARARLIIEEG